MNQIVDNQIKNLSSKEQELLKNISDAMKKVFELEQKVIEKEEDGN
ncbi:MAG: hypothetical protein WCO23_00925 [bacterium]